MNIRCIITFLSNWGSPTRNSCTSVSLSPLLLILLFIRWLLIIIVNVNGIDVCNASYYFFHFTLLFMYQFHFSLIALYKYIRICVIVTFAANIVAQITDRTIKYRFGISKLSITSITVSFHMLLYRINKIFQLGILIWHVEIQYHVDERPFVIHQIKNKQNGSYIYIFVEYDDSPKISDSTCVIMLCYQGDGKRQ